MITPLRFSGDAAQRAETITELWAKTQGATDGDAIDMNLFTAARASATFPYVSPAAQVALDSQEELHFRLLDGGYYDNFGIQTALDFLRHGFYHENWKPDETNGITTKPKHILIIEMRLTNNESANKLKDRPMGSVQAEYLGPALGALNVVFNAQIENNNIDITAFKQAAEAAGIPTAILTLQPFDSVPGPLSWHLSAKDKELFADSFGDAEISEDCNLSSAPYDGCSASDLVLKGWNTTNCLAEMNDFLDSPSSPKDADRFVENCVARKEVTEQVMELDVSLDTRSRQMNLPSN